MIRFRKNVSDEDRRLLLKELDRYEEEVPMTRSERNDLYKWVAQGNSPYWCGDPYMGGTAKDYIGYIRFWNEMYKELKEKERNGTLEEYLDDLRGTSGDSSAEEFSRIADE